MADDNKYQPPEPGRGDTGHSVVKAGLGSIPLVGAAASELFGLIVTPPLEKRRSEWMASVGAVLRDIEKELDLVLEDLQKREDFIDVAIEASEIAVRTSSQEKRDALRNALLNAALPSPPEESLEKMFLSFVDQFSAWHIRILRLFKEPTEYLATQEQRFDGPPCRFSQPSS